MKALKKNIPAVVSKLNQVRIKDIVDRDKLYNQIEKKGALTIKKRFGSKRAKE